MASRDLDSQHAYERFTGHLPPLLTGRDGRALRPTRRSSARGTLEAASQSRPSEAGGERADDRAVGQVGGDGHERGVATVVHEHETRGLEQGRTA